MRLFALICIFLLSGCGYKPLSYYAKTAFGKSVYVEIKNRSDFPQAGVNLKDRLNRVVLARLHLELASKEKAESILEAEITDLNFETISQDTQGFANYYRANIKVAFNYQVLDGERYQVVLESSSDYASDESLNSIMIEENQMNAIDSALKNIVDQFVSRIFYQGTLYQRKNANNTQ